MLIIFPIRLVAYHHWSKYGSNMPIASLPTPAYEDHLCSSCCTTLYNADSLSLYLPSSWSFPWPWKRTFSSTTVTRRERKEIQFNYTATTMPNDFIGWIVAIAVVPQNSLVHSSPTISLLSTFRNFTTGHALRPNSSECFLHLSLVGPDRCRGCRIRVWRERPLEGDGRA